MKTHLRVLLFAFTLLSAALTFPFIPISNTGKSMMSSEPQVTHQSVCSYTTHDPIVISSDADWETQSWPGSGTEEVPYLIEGLNITADGVCIIIGSMVYMTSYFEIRNCLLYSTGLAPDSGGISCKRVIGGIIENNTIISGDMGIYLSRTNECSVVSNNVTMSAEGIYIELSDSCLIVDNYISDCIIGAVSSSVSRAKWRGNVIKNGYAGILVDGNPGNYDNQFYLNLFDATLPVYDDDGFNNTWDDGASQGNFWIDFDGSGTYTIPGLTGSIDRFPLGIPLVTDNPDDIAFREDEIGFFLTWNASGLAPENWEIFQDGVLVASDDWDGEMDGYSNHITHTLDGLNPGYYNFTLATYGYDVEVPLWIELPSETPPLVQCTDTVFVDVSIWMYTPGVYPDGISFTDGCVLDGSSGGAFIVIGAFRIPDGVTVSIISGYNIVVHADEIIIDGTLDCDGAGAQGGAYAPVSGSSPVPGGGGMYGNTAIDSLNHLGGGGGGAYGNDGGDGLGFTDFGFGAGGIEYGLHLLPSSYPSPYDIYMGAAGGTGGDDRTDFIWYYGGSGGNGGGCVYLSSIGDINVTGIISSDGSNGGNGQYTPHGNWYAGGGGGGAGGGILLAGDRVSLSGTLSAQGGDRGGGGFEQNYVSGGAGSGGRIKIIYASAMDLTSGTINVQSGLDRFGNRLYPGTYFAYHNDNLLPTFRLNGLNNQSYLKPNTSISILIEDCCNITQVSYNWDGFTNTSIALETITFELNTTTPELTGIHSLFLYGLDYGGLWNSSLFVFTIDDTPPEIILLAPENETSIESNIYLNFSITDDYVVSNVFFNWDGDSNTSLSSPYSIQSHSEDGFHILTIYVEDAAGNLQSSVFFYIVDNFDPLINSPEDMEFIEEMLGMNITWIPTDVNPSYYVITRNGVSIESGDWISGVSITLNLDGLSNGTYVFTIVVFDLMGNIVTDSVVVTVVLPSTISITTTTTSTTTATSTTTSSNTSLTPDGIVLVMALVLGTGIGAAAVVLIVIVFLRRKS